MFGIADLSENQMLSITFVQVVPWKMLLYSRSRTSQEAQLLQVAGTSPSDILFTF